MKIKLLATLATVCLFSGQAMALDLPENFKNATFYSIKNKNAMKKAYLEHFNFVAFENQSSNIPLQCMPTQKLDKNKWVNDIVDSKENQKNMAGVIVYGNTASFANGRGELFLRAFKNETDCQKEVDFSTTHLQLFNYEIDGGCKSTNGKKWTSLRDVAETYKNGLYEYNADRNKIKIIFAEGGDVLTGLLKMYGAYDRVFYKTMEDCQKDTAPKLW